MSNIWDSLAHMGHGFTHSMYRHQLKNDPKLRREMAKKAGAAADRCTPCAAGKYVEGLRTAFGVKR